MKKMKRIIVLVLTMALLCSTSVFAQETDNYLYNDYGSAVPAPNGYSLSGVYSGKDLGIDSLKTPQDLFVDGDKNIYIADTGNNRIVILDENLQYKKEIKEFKNTEIPTLLEPYGVYVSKDGYLYICDSGNARVIKSDMDANVITEYKKPDTNVLTEDFVFKPYKVALDSAGGVYVVAFGLYQGLIYYNNDGDFLNFYGSNRIEVTVQVLADNLWKKIFTKEQRESSKREIPTEYSNLYIDKDNFIYTTTLKTDNSIDEAKKLNALGNNVLKINSYNTYYSKNNYGDIDVEWSKGIKVDNSFVDVFVGEDGNMVLLDNERCRFFEYSKDNDLITVYGTKSNKKGDFLNPTAIDMVNGKYLILDAEKNNITVIEPTEYMNKLKGMLTYYSEGLYEETIEGFEEILKENNNLSLAYKSIGKAYLQKGEYKKALDYLKKANDRQGYSDAFKEYRKEFIRDNLLILLAGAIIVIIALKIFLSKFRAWLIKGREDEI
ncbi:MAG: hypothetical protein E7480_02580 [Ruminococcaceae bacterium]|nr:hypothetical protein [Oscillospiraceae bacterium]